MERVLNKLASYLENIENAKKAIASLEGEEKGAIKLLRENLGVKSEEEAEARIKKMEQTQIVLEKDIKAKLEKVEKEYDW